MATRKAGKASDGGLTSNWRSWLLAALLIAALVLAALHWGDVKKFAALLKTARPQWLAVAAALQVATYIGLAAQWWLVLSKAKTPRKPGDLFRLTLAKHFADQVVPTAGVSGNVVLVDRLVTLGVPRGNAVAALLLQVIAYYLSYAAGALWVLVVLYWKDRARVVLTGRVFLFLGGGVCIPAVDFWLHRRGQKDLPPWVSRWSKAREFMELVGEAPRELIRDPHLIAWLTLFNGLVFL